MPGKYTCRIVWWIDTKLGKGTGEIGGGKVQFLFYVPFHCLDVLQWTDTL